MSKYVTKPEYVEAITFAELVQYGIEHGGNVVEGMPWSFEYKGKPITHENNECYLVPGEKGEVMRFTPRHMLMNDEQGNLFTCDMDIFNQVYDKIDP